jgi:hypothetical protein
LEFGLVEFDCEMLGLFMTAGEMLRSQHHSLNNLYKNVFSSPFSTTVVSSLKTHKGAAKRWKKLGSGQFKRVSWFSITVG